MKFRIQDANVGTCLQGEIKVEYKKLVNVFGEHGIGDGYKTDAEWGILFEDGTVATIYNWKDGKNYNGESGDAVEDIVNWHIGGTNKLAVQRVLEALYGVKEDIEELIESERL